MRNYPSYLVHYASPYYDPVKAHQYYMDHRKLKGRKKASEITNTLPEQGQLTPRTSEYYVKRMKELKEEEARKKQETASSQKVNSSKQPVSNEVTSETSSSTTKKRGTLNEKGQAAKKELRERINAERDSRLSAEDSNRNSRLSSEDAFKESQLNSAKTTKEQTVSANKTSLEQAKTQRQKEIKNHVLETRNKVNILAEKIRYGNLSTEEKKSIIREINDLYDENAKKRAELDNAFLNKSAQISTNISNAKTKYSNDTNSIRETSKNNKTAIREESKNTKTAIREESKNKYNEELDKIYSKSEYLKPSKSKRKRSS